MADGQTPNFDFVLPEIDGSNDTWGIKLNDNWSKLDTTLGSLGGKLLGNIQHKTGPGTGGSTVSQGSWQTKTLNEIIVNEDSQISLSSNVFSVVGGGTVEWLFCFSGYATGSTGVPFMAVKTRLFCTTDSAVAAEGVM